jgi:3-phenylpropionate/cinnamic acid dioxygenase small subunit
MELWQLVAREHIRETIASYAHLVDSGRFDDVVALFTTDGALEVQNGESARGHDGLRAFFTGVGRDLADASAVPMIRHNTSNLSINLVSETEATARCYFLAVTEHGLDHWGRYRDRLVRADDRWLFAHRSVRTDGAVAGGWAEHRR